MAETTASRPWARRLTYLVTVLLTATATVGVLLLLLNIRERKEEAKKHVFQVVDLTEDTIDPQVWGRNFPRQYDGYKRTVDRERTKHGGSEAIDKLTGDPRLVAIYEDYAFSKDFREERGHAYMLKDQDETRRVVIVNQPGSCLHCHSAVLPAYRKAGNGNVMDGFRAICATPWHEARKLVEHPVSCIDCHDPGTAEIRVTRPGFLVGIQQLAHFLADYRAAKEDKKKPADKQRYQEVMPHLPSLERYAQANARLPRAQRTPYDPNKEATRQELRSFVCGQCHVEYYFDKKDNNLLVYPWAKGLKVEDIESYYDENEFTDWTQKKAGSNLLKAQHPEFELWNQGIHARSGVACADCHMPYKRDGAVKISDHHVRSPLMKDSIARACQTCHRQTEAELLARAEIIQDRTRALLDRAEDAVVELIKGLKESKAPAGRLQQAHGLHRKAQWRLDFVLAENSMGFHAPQESARILAEAIDYARQGQLKIVQSSRE